MSNQSKKQRTEAELYDNGVNPLTLPLNAAAIANSNACLEKIIFIFFNSTITQ